jgi:hypothetical protein
MAVAAASAPLWRRLWDTQIHGLRIWLGVYALAMLGVLTTAFDVYVRTRHDGPSYERLWLSGWPLWSAGWLALVPAGIAVGYWLPAFLPLVLLVIGLLYLSYRFQAQRIRRRAGGDVDADEAVQADLSQRHLTG